MQISAKYQPKTPDGQQWMNNYHAKLYNLTDEAIRGAGGGGHAFRHAEKTVACMGAACRQLLQHTAFQTCNIVRQVCQGWASSVLPHPIDEANQGCGTACRQLPAVLQHTALFGFYLSSKRCQEGFTPPVLPRLPPAYVRHTYIHFTSRLPIFKSIYQQLTTWLLILPAIIRIMYAVLHALLPAACPRNTRWVVVTNGDNDYDPKFLSVLVQQRDAEAVAFDYYSRYQRPTGLCVWFTVSYTSCCGRHGALSLALAMFQSTIRLHASPFATLLLQQYDGKYEVL
jgi:hypothetical protein